MQERRAILLTVHEDNGEVVDLGASAGLDIVETVHQSRSRPDNRSYLGRGAVQAVARRLRVGRGAEEPLDEDVERLEGGAAEGAPLEDIQIGLVADSLKPNQVLRLQREFGIEVWDRTRLILEIFADRASSREARLQVELARHEYELPLVREAIHIAKSGERPGFMGGGEMGFVEYQNHIRGRMARIREELENVSRERSVRRANRRRGGLWLVALAGYTNAGKSTLLNALTEGGATTENRLFSTLATRTRRISYGGVSQLLLTDTVGFIEHLPPWLVDAFHATLEEITLADVVLLVVDASDPIEELERKLFTSLRTLRQLRAEAEVDQAERLVIAFNKMDLSPHDRDRLVQVAERVGLEDDCVLTSARTGEGLKDLLRGARERIDDRVTVHLEVPAHGQGQALVAWASEAGEATTNQHDGVFELEVGISKASADELQNRTKAAGGRVISVHGTE